MMSVSPDYFPQMQRIHDLTVLWLSNCKKVEDLSPEELVALYKKIHDQIGEAFMP